MPDNLNLDTGERRINEAVCIEELHFFQEASDLLTKRLR